MCYADECLIILIKNDSIRTSKFSKALQTVIVAHKYVRIIDSSRSECNQPAIQVTRNLSIRLILCLSTLTRRHASNDVKNSIEVNDCIYERTFSIVCPRPIEILIRIVDGSHIWLVDEELISEK